MGRFLKVNVYNTTEWIITILQDKKQEACLLVKIIQNGIEIENISTIKLSDEILKQIAIMLKVDKP